MKALVLRQPGQDPALDEFDEPAAGEGQEVVNVIAAGLNPYDRYLSQSPDTKTPKVVGIEAVAELGSGKRAYVEGVSPFGSVAEKTLIKTAKAIELPNGIEPGDALVIGIAGLAGWLPLSWKAGLKPGESVLVLGATGVQGQVAVQAAKLLGAGRVVAAGRNQGVLESLKQRGADDIAVLEGDLTEAIRKAAPDGGYDVVIDSLFGEPFKGLMQSGTLKPNSRVVVVGGSAGQESSLNFRDLQGAKGATIAGYGTFFVPPDIKNAAYLAMAEYVINGKLKVDVQAFPLGRAEEAWQTLGHGPHGKIIVTP